MKIKIDSLPSKATLSWLSSITLSLMSVSRKRGQRKRETATQRPTGDQGTCLPNETSSKVHDNRFPWCR